MRNEILCSHLLGGFYLKFDVDFWSSEEGILLLAGWARRGLNNSQIAKKIGISRATLAEWKKKNNKIFQALKKNKEVVDMEVEGALLSKALSGDVRACSYWLKNRMSDVWADRVKNNNGDYGSLETDIEQELCNLLSGATEERSVYEDNFGEGFHE